VDEKLCSWISPEGKIRGNDLDPIRLCEFC